MARMLSFAFEWGKSSLSRGKYDWASPLVPESSRLNRWTWFDSFPLGWVTLLWTHISEAPISGTDLSIDTQHWMRMNPTCKIREVDQTTRVMEQAGPSEIAPQVPSSTGLGPAEQQAYDFKLKQEHDRELLEFIRHHTQIEPKYNFVMQLAENLQIQNP